MKEKKKEKEVSSFGSKKKPSFPFTKMELEGTKGKGCRLLVVERSDCFVMEGKNGRRFLTDRCSAKEGKEDAHPIHLEKKGTIIACMIGKKGETLPILKPGRRGLISSGEGKEEKRLVQIGRREKKKHLR